MQRIFTVLTLTCLTLTFFVSYAAYADFNGDVDVAEKNITTDKDDADTQYNVMQNANILYLLAKSEYEANETKIKRGKNVTAVKLLAATVSVYVSGTLTAPVAVSTLVDMLDLSASIDDSTTLLDAYETAISRKYNEVEQFDILSIAYNITYDIYIEVLAEHTGWTESYLSTYIENEYNRRQGIQHNGSTTPSDKHGIEGKKEWGEYDDTFPSYPCEGPCTVSFMTPTSEHVIQCGSSDDPGTSKVGGCWFRYHSCDIYEKAIHTPGRCEGKLWDEAWTRGPNGESVPFWRLIDCGEWTRVCLLHVGGHAFPLTPGDNNFNMFHFLNIYNDDGTIQTSTQAYNNLIIEEQTIPSNSNQLCSACNETYTSSETSECSTCSSDGDESASTDGSSDCASCTSTNECSACYTTETSTLASEANTETVSTSTSTPTAPGLYPVGASLATVNGQEMPSLAPGDSHTAKLITKSGGYAIVHWYLLPPGDSRTYGDELFPTTYAQGSTVETEVTFSFTFPSSAVGVYKLTAYIYPHSSASDQTCYEYSYLIYVS